MIVAADFTFLVQLLAFNLPRLIARPTISHSHSSHSPLLFFLATRSYSQLTLQQHANNNPTNNNSYKLSLSHSYTHTHTSFLPSLPFLSFPFLSFSFLFFSFLSFPFLSFSPKPPTPLSLSLSLSSQSVSESAGEFSSVLVGKVLIL